MLYNITASGCIKSANKTVRILAEGNKFINVTNIIGKNLVRLYFPLMESDCKTCVTYLGRPCEANIIQNSIGTGVEKYASVLTQPRNRIIGNIKTTHDLNTI